MNTYSNISAWIHQAYLYISSIIALIICIIGAVTLLNITIRTVVFGVTSSWYENPREQCRYEVKDTEDSIAIYSSLHDCIAAKEVDSATRARYDIARDVSSGMAMVLIGFPVYWYHWRRIQKLQTTAEC